MKQQADINIALRPALLALALSAVASFVFAHGEVRRDNRKAANPTSAQEHAFGQQGDPNKATRTVALDMTDMMRFTPNEITVRQGETVTFVVAD